MGHHITKQTKIEKIEALSPSCKCKKCSHGCTLGSGYFVKGEVEKVAAFLNISLKEMENLTETNDLFNKKMTRPKLLDHPYGKCVFFKEGKCSIHPVKPLQCKIATGCQDYGYKLNQWFMLNYMIDKDDPESIRQFAQYLKTGGETLPGGSLSDFVPNKEILKKILSYEILH